MCEIGSVGIVAYIQMMKLGRASTYHRHRGARVDCPKGIRLPKPHVGGAQATEAAGVGHAATRLHGVHVRRGSEARGASALGYDDLQKNAFSCQRRRPLGPHLVTSSLPHVGEPFRAAPPTASRLSYLANMGFLETYALRASSTRKLRP
jgi:hypothetical protein